jgi:type II secretory pathway component PulJ
MLNAKSITRQAGVGLVELMVGTVVALVVLWGISMVYVNSTGAGRTSSAATQLNQDLRAAMDIMTSDIRRAGSWGAGSAGGTNPFTVVGTTNLAISSNRKCILYSYDATHAGGTAGVVDAVDVFGFRLSGGNLQTIVPGSLTTTAVSACTNDALWESLTDGRALTVDMTLDTVSSKCVAYQPGSYDADDSTTYTAWATTGGYGPACVAAVADGGPPTPPAATNTFIETRQVNITLTATSQTDATLTRTLIESALVRNNRVIKP